MNLMLEDLLAVLQEETGLYGLVLRLAQSEKDAVTSSDLDELNKIAKEKEALFFKIRTVEEQRERVTENLAESMGCPPQDLTLSKLSKRVKEPYASRLKDCRSSLLALVKILRKVNSSNSNLLKHSIELVRSSFSFLGTLTSSVTVYHSTGKMLASNRSGRVLSGEL